MEYCNQIWRLIHVQEMRDDIFSGNLEEVLVTGVVIFTNQRKNNFVENWALSCHLMESGVSHVIYLQLKFKNNIIQRAIKD